MNFKQKSELAYRQIKKFGCNLSSLLFILKLFLKKKGSIIHYVSKKYKNQVCLRNNTSDIPVYDEVLLKEDYRIDVPIHPSTILDCGANIGLTTVYFNNKFPDAKIICIEPESSNYEMLRENVGQHKNIVTYQAGIWNKSTYLTIENEQAEKYAFTVRETSEITKETVRAISIPDVMKENQWETIDILKIDVEGAEKELFASNYDNWLPKTKLIIIELHDRMKPGCSKTFFNALAHYNFEMAVRGENIFCLLKH